MANKVSAVTAVFWIIKPAFSLPAASGLVLLRPATRNWTALYNPGVEALKVRPYPGAIGAAKRPERRLRPLRPIC